MKKQSTFGNATLAKKMASRFSSNQKSVKVEMRYNKQVQEFIRKVDDVHQKASESTLAFG